MIFITISESTCFKDISCLLLHFQIFLEVYARRQNCKNLIKCFYLDLKIKFPSKNFKIVTKLNQIFSPKTKKFHCFVHFRQFTHSIDFQTIISDISRVISFLISPQMFHLCAIDSQENFSK